MQPLTVLDNDAAFPPSSAALKDPSGLLAIGGELSVERLITAYRQGIFPWYEAPQPVLWWTPDPRSVLFPDALHVSRSLRKTLKRNGYTLSVDRTFASVVRACASPRKDSMGTWIDDNMLTAYTALHGLGKAHSIEVSNRAGAMVGGLYGVALGGVFFGESMFSVETDASKVAMVALVHIMRRGCFHMIDCQIENAHLNSLGARNISRVDFERRLAHTVDTKIDSEVWQIPAQCGDLL